MSIGPRSKFLRAIFGLTVLAIGAGGAVIYADRAQPVGAVGIDRSSEDELQPYHGVDDKWGFISQSGNVVIAERFEKVGDFADGLAPVKLDGKWGFVNTTGQMVIEPQFEDMPEISEGRILIKSHEKSGFMDTTGAIAIPPQYDEAEPFDDGLAKIKLNGKYGYIDPAGTIVIAPKYDDSWRFSYGLANVARGGRWGFIDKSGTEVIPLQYDTVSLFNDEGTKGTATAILNDRCFTIDRTGRKVRDLTANECPDID